MVNVLAIKVNGRAKIALYRYAQIYALVEVSVVKVLASVTKVTLVKIAPSLINNTNAQKHVINVVLA
jgi:hypothetical protein